MTLKLRDIINEIRVNRPGKIILKQDNRAGYENYLMSDKIPIVFYQNNHQKRVNELDTDLIPFSKKEETFDLFKKFKIPVKSIHQSFEGHFTLRIYKADKYFTFPELN